MKNPQPAGRDESKKATAKPDDKKQWNDIMKRAKAAWSQLTDADFKKADGSIDKLYDVIHKRVGETREAVQAKLKVAPV